MPRRSRRSASPAATAPTPSGGETGSPGAVAPSLIVSEVAPWSSGDSPFGADWIELTNTGAHAVDITGFRIDDSSNAFAGAVALNGVTTLAAGESAIFLEGEPAVADAFKAAWFGTNVPAGLQVGTYIGGGIGLSTDGDAVNVFDAAGNRITSVTFGASTTYFTFDNAAGLTGAISTLSVAGVNGAFMAGGATGSPGAIAAPYEEVTAGAPVSGLVPPQLSIALGAAAVFSPFVAGHARDYQASTTATVTSTAGEATLSVADVATTAPGHLVNGPFALPQALQITADGGTYAPDRPHAAALRRPSLQRRSDDRRQADDRRAGRPAYGHVRQVADVHAVDHHTVPQIDKHPASPGNVETGSWSQRRLRARTDFPSEEQQMARVPGLWVYQRFGLPGSGCRRRAGTAPRPAMADGGGGQGTQRPRSRLAARDASRDARAGMRLGVHGYVGRPTPKPVAEANAFASAIDVAQADFAIVNAEKEYERSTNPDSAAFTRRYRSLKDDFTTYFSSFGRPDCAQDLNWAAWADAGFLGMPQAYENLNRDKLDARLCIADWARFFDRADIRPTLGCFSEDGKPPALSTSTTRCSWPTPPPARWASCVARAADGARAARSRPRGACRGQPARGRPPARRPGRHRPPAGRRARRPAAQRIAPAPGTGRPGARRTSPRPGGSRRSAATSWPTSGTS